MFFWKKYTKIPHSNASFFESFQILNVYIPNWLLVPTFYLDEKKL